MLPELLRRVSLFRVLHQIDQNLAEGCRQSGCPYCNGILHYAPYYRKARGGPKDLPEEYSKRLSLCCSREECRRRVLPPSCLFQGRKVYWKAVILITMTLHQRRSGGVSANQLMRMFSISRKTIIRWLRYYHDVFPKSQEWQSVRGFIEVAVSDLRLPGSLLSYFMKHSSTTSTGVINCLRFLALGQVR